MAITTAAVMLSGCTVSSSVPETPSEPESEVVVQDTPRPVSDPDDNSYLDLIGEEESDGNEGEDVKPVRTEGLPAMDVTYHATDGTYTYYREYKMDDFSDPVYLYFSSPFTQNAEGSRMHVIRRMDSDGNIETLTDKDPGFGQMYYAGGKLFSQGMNIKQEGYSTVYYWDLENKESSYKTREDYTYLQGVYGDYIFCEKLYKPDEGCNGGNCIVNAKNMSELASVDGIFLGADEKGMYWYERTEGTEVETKDLFVKIYVTDYQGNTTLIAEIGPEEFAKNETYYSEGISDYGLLEIPCFEIFDDIVVFNIGYYAGTGRFFSGGIVCYANKEGHGSYYVCNNSFEGFLATYTDTGVSVTICDYDPENEAYDSITYSLAGGMNEVKGYNGEKKDEVFVCREDSPKKQCVDLDGNTVQLQKGDVAVYAGDDGMAYRLLTKDEYESFGYVVVSDDESESAPKTELYNAEYVGDKLFFTVSYMAREESEDIGWRYAYRHSLSTDFVKDLKTGEVKVLVNYGPDNTNVNRQEIN